MSIQKERPKTSDERVTYGARSRLKRMGQIGKGKRITENKSKEEMKVPEMRCSKRKMY